MGLRSSAILLTFLSFSAAALADHDYDMNQSKTVTGAVTKVEWGNNDYVKIHMNAPGNDGKTADWEIQTLSANALQSDGITSDNLKDGQRITVQGHPASNGSAHLLATRISLSSGRSVALNTNSSEPASPTTATNAAPATGPATAENQTNNTLPSTASDVPLLGLFGLALVAAGGLMALRRAVDR